MQQELDDAEDRADDAEDRANDAEDKLSELKSGKLIRHGITGGIGPAFHVPLHRSSNEAMTIAPSNLSALTYVMLHPAYWGSRPEQDLYCANKWAGASDRADAIHASEASALKRAENRMELLFDVIRVHQAAEAPTITSDSIVSSGADRRMYRRLEKTEHLLTILSATHGSTLYSAVSPADRATRRDYERSKKLLQNIKKFGHKSDFTSYVASEVGAASAGTVSDYKNSVEALIQKIDAGHYPELSGLTQDQITLAVNIVVAETSGADKVNNAAGVEMDLDDAKAALAVGMRGTVIRWQVDVDAKCGWHRFAGIWFGYALPFKVTVPVTADMGTSHSRAEVQVKNAFAFGYGISPSSYFSMFTGLTVGTTNLHADNDRELVMTWMIGFGGNLDFLTLFQGN